MTEFVRRYRLFFTTLGLTVIACQLMSASIHNRALAKMGGRLVSSALAPMEELYHELTFTLSSAWSHYVWLQSVEEERNVYATRVKELEAQNSRLIEYRHENERLRQLLNFKEVSKLEGLAASVIGRDPSNWARTITIDRGSNDGLRTAMPVVDGSAVVGQTIVVSPGAARVLLLTDNTSAIDALVQDSRAQGIVEGTLEKKLKLRYVLKEYEVHAGDRVIASGLDGVFPKGTLIGVVTRVDPAVSGQFQRIEVQPSIDVNRLENVFVIASGAQTTTTSAGDAAAP